MNELIHPKIVYYVKKECDTNWGINNHKIHCYGFVFVLEGSADYIINGVPYHIEQGDILCIKPQSVRSATTPGMACVAIDFLLQDAEEMELPVVTPWGDLSDFRMG